MMTTEHVVLVLDHRLSYTPADVENILNILGVSFEYITPGAPLRYDAPIPPYLIRSRDRKWVVNKTTAELIDELRRKGWVLMPRRVFIRKSLDLSMGSLFKFKPELFPDKEKGEGE